MAAPATTKDAPDPPRKRKELQKRQPSVTRRRRRSWASRFGDFEVLRLIFINFTNKKKVERTFQDSHRQVFLFKRILFMASCKLEFRTLCSTAPEVNSHDRVDFG